MANGVTGGTGYNPFYLGGPTNPTTNQEWWKTFNTGIGVTPGGTNQMLPGGGLLSGIGAIGTSIADLISSNKRIGDQQGYLDEAQSDIDKFYRDFGSGKYDPKTSQSLIDAYSFGMRRPDTSGIQASTQTALNAASSDPRLLGGMLGSIQQNQAQAMNQANKQAMANQQAMMQGLGSAEQSTLNAKNAWQQQIATGKLDADMLARQQAKDNIELLKQQKRDAFGNIIGGVTNIGLSLAGMPSMPGLGGKNNVSTITSQNQLNKPSSEFDYLPSYLIGTHENGGKLPYAQGGMTPGEFSHERNPIHMMDDMGNKVGEATGGEMILNPEQSDAIEDAFEKVGRNPSKADLMALYETVRAIFTQPQFQD